MANRRARRPMRDQEGYETSWEMRGCQKPSDRILEITVDTRLELCHSLFRRQPQMKLDSFTTQYIATALWSSSDDNDRPMDSNYSIGDIAEESLAKMAADCKDFQDKAAEHITSDNLLRTSDEDTEGTFGHDFWLTRNGHGAGFWDGDYAEPSATILTALSKTFGSSDLYVGDDGKVYVS